MSTRPGSSPKPSAALFWHTIFFPEARKSTHAVRERHCPRSERASGVSSLLAGPSVLLGSPRPDPLLPVCRPGRQMLRLTSRGTMSLDRPRRRRRRYLRREKGVFSAKFKRDHACGQPARATHRHRAALPYGLVELLEVRRLPCLIYFEAASCLLGVNGRVRSQSKRLLDKESRIRARCPAARLASRSTTLNIGLGAFRSVEGNHHICSITFSHACRRDSISTSIQAEARGARGRHAKVLVRG